MHFLHRILVYIPDICCVGKNNPSVTKQQIRSYANNQTECFDGHVFDWREVDTAGRWSDEYPDNVILAADDPDRFLAELGKAQTYKREALCQALKFLEENELLDLKKMATAILEDEQDSPMESHRLSMAAYSLGSIADHLKGTYTYNSYFFDTHRCTSLMHKQIFEEIQEHPQLWALVIFFCHY